VSCVLFSWLKLVIFSAEEGNCDLAKQSIPKYEIRQQSGTWIYKFSLQHYRI
jgi:hypothetical protein